MNFLEGLFAPFGDFYEKNKQKFAAQTPPPPPTPIKKPRQRTRPREQPKTFLEGVFAPFGDYYAKSVEEIFNRDEVEHKHTDRSDWFDVIGELPERKKMEFVRWWFSTVTEADGKTIRPEYSDLGWTDFREKYGD